VDTALWDLKTRLLELRWRNYWACVVSTSPSIAARFHQLRRCAPARAAQPL